MKSRFVKSSIILASVVSGLGSSAVSVYAARKRAKKSDSGIGNIVESVGGFKTILGAIAASGGAYWTKDNIFPNKPYANESINEVTDVEAVATSVSQIYWQNPEDFKNRIKSFEFYQLYLPFKEGFSGWTSVSDRQKSEFRRDLEDEMCFRIKSGQLMGILDGYLMGEGVKEAKEQMEKYIDLCIKYNGLGALPMFLAFGRGGTGKSNGAEVINLILTGSRHVNLLHLAGVDDKEAAMVLEGTDPHFANSEGKPEIIKWQEDPNYKYCLVDIAEVGDVKGSALRILKDIITRNTLKWRYNGKEYVLYTPFFLDMNAPNGNEHEIKEAIGAGHLWDVFNMFDAKDARKNDFRNVYGDAILSRVTNQAFFGAPDHASFLDIVAKCIDSAKKDSTKPHITICANKGSPEYDKILDKVLEKVEEEKKGKVDVARDVVNNIDSVLRKMVDGYLPEGRYTSSGVDFEFSWNENKKDIDIKLVKAPPA